MSEMNPEFIIVFTTILISGIGIIIGTAIPSIVEGRAVLKALDGIIRQPEAADDIRTTLLIAMALLESASIYVLLVILILLFANPLVAQLFN
jgi:F-type H+-transporting ATPase subunit c